MCSSLPNEEKSGVSLLSLQLEQEKQHATPRRKMPKNVRFSTVQIREYTLVVGDHPLCEGGLAMSLDWAYSPQITVKNVVDVEHERESMLASSVSPPQRLGYMERKLRLQQASSEKDEVQRYVEKEQARSILWDEPGRDVIELESPDVHIVSSR